MGWLTYKNHLSPLWKEIHLSPNVERNTLQIWRNILYFGEKFRVIVLIIVLHKNDNSELPELIILHICWNPK